MPEQIKERCDYYLIVTKAAAKQSGLDPLRVKNRVLRSWGTRLAASPPIKGNQPMVYVDDGELSWAVVLSNRPAPNSGVTRFCAFIISCRPVK